MIAATVAARFCISLGTMSLVALPSATFSMASMLRRARIVVVGVGLVDHADGVGLGLLHGQQSLGFAFGLADALLLDGLGAQDGGLLFALGDG